jgi:hypothetical protein
MSRVAKMTTFVATLIATAVIGATPALAAPTHGGSGASAITSDLSENGQPVNLPHIDHSIMPVVHTVTVASARTGFDWSAAVIGALAAAAGCIVVIGLVLSVRRRHEPSAA